MSPSKTKPGDDKPGAGIKDAVQDSAQQIWQAGLGAFTRAQMEGGKAFEALVKEGVELQRKTQAAAEQRLAEAASKMSTLASDLTSRAPAPWDRLETLFEERVAKAMQRLGAPSAQDLQALTARVDALTAALKALEQRSPTGTQQATAPAPRRAAGKTTRRAKPQSD